MEIKRRLAILLAGGLVTASAGLYLVNNLKTTPKQETVPQHVIDYLQQQGLPPNESPANLEEMITTYTKLKKREKQEKQESRELEQQSLLEECIKSTQKRQSDPEFVKKHGNVVFNDTEGTRDLSKTNYIAAMVSANWCPNCPEYHYEFENLYNTRYKGGKEGVEFFVFKEIREGEQSDPNDPFVKLFGFWERTFKRFARRRRWNNYDVNLILVGRKIITVRKPLLWIGFRLLGK